MKPLAPNTLLQNRYLIVHLIGKGGMGEVYLAVDQRLGSAVALKRTFYANDEQLGSAFEREARTLARLRHAVLPKVSDHFIENENQFLVMEHISGDDLSKRLITTQKPFPLSWVLFWADQLLDALAYLHSHEPPIIHRDIKPQNLKLTDENNIVLLDFGLSKNSVNLTNSPSTGTGSTGSVVGYTPHYAPMEQIRGTGTNPRSDIYSLSATLYQLLTNVVPPDALTRADQIIGGKPDPIQSISEINSEIPKPISDVILRGMSISQEQRFATAREMQKVLREAYASMQNAMAAQTIAFNAQDTGAAPNQPVVGNSPQFSAAAAPPASSTQSYGTPEVGAQTIPYGMMENGSGHVSDAARAAEKAEKEEVDNFDATLRDYQPEEAAELPPVAKSPVSPNEYAAPVTDAPKQSGIKTEVFIQSDFAAGGYSSQETPSAARSTGPENYSAPQEPAAFDSGYQPDQTTPFVAFDRQVSEPPAFDQTQDISGFDAPAREENSRPAPVTRFAGDGFEPEPPPPSDQQSYAPAAPAPTPAPKKSKGFLFAIVGGLFALFVLAAAALGVGWYLMQDRGTTGNVNAATPTPETTPEPTPEATPEATPDQTLANTDVNANADANANANADANANTGNTSNAAEPVEPDRTTVPPTGRTTAPPPPQQQPRTPQQQQPRTPQQQQPRTPPQQKAGPTKTPRSQIIPQ